MTLCYEDEDNEGNTEVFIDDIHPDGLAAKDGRLRLGDQIIQVKGDNSRSNSALLLTSIISDQWSASEDKAEGPGDVCHNQGGYQSSCSETTS